jgi:hypothetical protein
VVTCSLSRTKTRDAVYTLIVSGSGRTYSLVVPQGSREAYDLQLLPQVGDKAQIELTAVDDG